MEARRAINEEEEKRNLSEYVVGRVPSVYYIPDFITEDEHQNLTHHIYQAPPSKWKSLKNRRLQNWGGVVHHKGLIPQHLPQWLSGITHRIYEESGLFPSEINHVLINEYLPTQGIMPHQDGPAYYPVVAILSLGSPVVMDFSPHVHLKTSADSMSNGIISVEGPPIMKPIEDKEVNQTFSIILMPRSLLIFKDEAYSGYLHGIKDREMQQYDKAVNPSESTKLNGVPSSLSFQESVDQQRSATLHRTAPRVSLTCRVVTRVHKNLFKF